MKKLFALGALVVVSGTLVAGDGPAPTALATLTLQSPTPESVGAMTFGPENILFVADAAGAQLFALDVADMEDGTGGPVHLDGVDRTIAALLGIEASELLVNDLAVHPASQNVYLSLTRGRGEEQHPLIMRVTSAGEISEVPFQEMSYSVAEIQNAPGMDQRYGRRAMARTFTVTDIAFTDGEVYVAGLSNEEFASNLRRIPFPFTGDHSATSLQIYHVSHGQNETHAPVMTFMPRSVGGETHIMAAYTCTPLVQFKAGDLSDGEHVIGKTIAELGAGNRPLDMISYWVDGQERILISNSRHPLMKLDPAKFAGAQSLEHPTQEIGVPFETIDQPGIRQMDNLNDEWVVLLQQDGQDGPMNLRSLEKASL